MSLIRTGNSSSAPKAVDLSGTSLAISEPNDMQSMVKLSSSGATTSTSLQGTSLSGQATYGMCLVSSASTISAPPQTLKGQNLQVVGGTIPLASAAVGANQVIYPRLAPSGFSQAIPVSTSSIGQPMAIQHLPSKVPLCNTSQVTNQTGIQLGSVSPGKAISIRLPTGSQSRPSVASFSPAQLQKVGPPSIVTVSPAPQLGLKTTGGAGQQVSIQRAVSPLVAQHMSTTNQQSFIQCISAATMLPHQMIQGSTPVGSSHASLPVKGTLRSVSPVATAAIVSSSPHLNQATVVGNQPSSLHSRPPVAFIANAPPAGMTLTVTSISPGSAPLQTSASSSSNQLHPTGQQVLWSGSSISQGQIIRTGIPVVLPRGAVTFTGRPRIVQSGSGPRLIQKPMVGLSPSSGGQVTLQVPQIISSVMKSVNQSATLTGPGNEPMQITSTLQPVPDTPSTLIVSSSSITSSSQATTAVATTAAGTPIRQHIESNNSDFLQAIAVGDGTTHTSVVDPDPLVAVNAAVNARGDGPCSFPKAFCLEKTEDKIKAVKTPSSVDLVASTGLSAMHSDNAVDSGSYGVINGVEVNNRRTPEILALTNLETTKATSSVGCEAFQNGLDLGSICDNQNDPHIKRLSTPSLKSRTVPDGLVNKTASLIRAGTTDYEAKLSNESVSSNVDHGKLSLTAEPSCGDKRCEAEGVILTEGYIDSNLLEWSDGVGQLPGTDMKFKINEFGDLELVDEGNVNADINSNKMEVDGLDSATNTQVNKKLDDIMAVKEKPVGDPSELSDHEGDPVCCCVYCGRYGYKSNFKASGKFCSQNCSGKRKLERKQLMISRMMIGMKKKKKVITSLEGSSQEQQSGPEITQKKLIHFNWEAYLAETKAVAAPKHLFKEPFPTNRNGFRAGMRLEGVDPKHQSLFCVMSVSEIQGYRMRLHFDGYSECYDFWVNADSPFIYPVGWAEKNGKVLQPPKNVPLGEFNWTSYLKQLRAVAAPKHLFLNQPSTVVPSAFRVGMKLEAVDKKNSNLICVASVADILGDRILVHFDGWEDTYDYWCDITSPSIHPVGWCQENNYTLSSPPDYAESATFCWENYLRDTNSCPVPARAFKTRAPIGFKKGMKVEVTDKRNPILVRAASIADIQDNRLLVHFDGWDSIYDYWVDDDCCDLHPINWCSKTDHPLQGPIDKKNLRYNPDAGGCPTLGCNGVGHIKGSKYTGHHSAFGCPYSEINMSKESALTDRLGSSRSEEGPAMSSRYDYTLDKKYSSASCDGISRVTGKLSNGCLPADKVFTKEKHEIVTDSKLAGKVNRGRKKKLYDLDNDSTDKMIKLEPKEEAEEMSEDRSALHASIHESVFQTSAPSPTSADQPLCWEQHAKLLPGVTEVSQTLVSRWTVEEVAAFILRLTGKEEQAQKFREEQVDGDSFLLLQQSDLMNFLNIKLGPAVKIFNSILFLKAASESD